MGGEIDRENQDEKCLIEILSTSQMPSLNTTFTTLNYNMKQSLNLYLKSVGKDPAKMWKKIEEAIAMVYKEKEEFMSRAAAMAFKTTR